MSSLRVLCEPFSVKIRGSQRTRREDTKETKEGISRVLSLFPDSCFYKYPGLMCLPVYRSLDSVDLIPIVVLRFQRKYMMKQLIL